MSAWKILQKIIEEGLLREDPIPSAGAASPLANLNTADDNITVIKRTSKPNTFSVQVEEFNHILSMAKAGKKIVIKVLSKIDDKPIAVLDTKDVLTSFLKLKPTLDPDMRGANYYVCKIPKESFGKVRGKGPGAY